MKNRLLGTILLVTSTLCISAVSMANDNASNTTEKSKAIAITDNTFQCIRDLTKVDGFYVDNLLGDVDATVKVAKSATGGKYPVGSVIQLVPTEAMVKQPSGFSPATNDWEFFELTVDASGSKIHKRGFANVVNRFGGNCLGCHIKAKPQWDMVCKTGHGCDPIPLTKIMLSGIQKTDPRCKTPAKLSKPEMAALMQLKQAMAKLKK